MELSILVQHGHNLPNRTSFRALKKRGVLPLPLSPHVLSLCVSNSSVQAPLPPHSPHTTGVHQSSLTAVTRQVETSHTPDS